MQMRDEDWCKRLSFDSNTIPIGFNNDIAARYMIISRIMLAFAAYQTFTSSDE